MYDAIRTGCRGTLAALVAGGVPPEDRQLVMLATKLADATSLALVLTMHGPWDHWDASVSLGPASTSPDESLGNGGGFDAFGRGPLHYASTSTITDILCSSLGNTHDSGSSSGVGTKDASRSVSLLLASDCLGRSPLHACIGLGQNGPLPILLRQPQVLHRLDAQDAVGMSALGYAVLGAAGCLIGALACNAPASTAGSRSASSSDSQHPRATVALSDDAEIPSRRATRRLDRDTLGSMQALHALLASGGDATSR